MHQEILFSQLAFNSNIMIKSFITLFLILLSTFIWAQQTDFDPPVKIPIVLNGNFGEIRGNHFHAGIDIHTKGETRLPIYSIDDGFVSRVSVSASGYGNAIYIDHPSGYTSVYAHLDQFEPSLAEWVKSEQYHEKSFEINLTPSKNQFRIKRGQEIAKSGNSGSSAGPHLHFEIRRTANQHPVNPLFFNFDIKDHTKPSVENLYVYPLSDSSQVSGNTKKQLYKLVYFGGAYHLKGIQSLNVYGTIGFSVDAIDYLDNNWSKCGIYQLEYWVDNQLINSFQLDELNYDKSRYLNSHIDYEAYQKTQAKFHKTYIDPGNKLDIYRQTYNGGLFNFDDGKRHNVQIMLYDVNMNVAEIQFYVLSTKAMKHPEVKSNGTLNYHTDNNYKTEEMELHIPINALYTNLNFEYQKGRSPAGAFSSLHRIQDKYTPLHIAFDLKIKASHLPDNLSSKAIIAQFDTKTEKYTSIGGTFDDGWVKTTAKNFGTFCIVIDTIAPSIRSLSLKDNVLTEQDHLRFKIDDDFSGIKTYNGTIDGKWILFEYDAKRNLLVYNFDEHLKKGKNHKLVLIVEDRKENKRTYNATFYY